MRFFSLVILVGLSITGSLGDGSIKGIPLKSKNKMSANIAEDAGFRSSGLLTERSLFPPLRKRASQACVDQGYYKCAKYDYCCEDGLNCCPDDTCCNPNSNCWGFLKCCLKTAQTCGGNLCCSPGDKCCGSGSGKYCCRPGESCCDGGCCESGYKCCGVGCAPNGSVCCPGNYHCPAGYTCSAPDSCVPGGGGGNNPTTTTTATTEFDSSTTISEGTTSFTSTESSVAISVSTTATTTSSASTTTTSSGATPTITFVYVAGLTDYLVSNICLGFQKRGKTQTDTLTYDPSDKTAKRKAAGCVTGKCNYPSTGFSCDEYPFASTAEGGANAAIGCIPAYQNTDQGGYLSSFWAYEKITPGQQFGVAVTGVTCSLFTQVGPKPPQSGKREIEDDKAERDIDAGEKELVKRKDINMQGSNSTVLQPYAIGDSSAGRIVLSLGDVDEGTYTVTAQASTTFTSVQLVDSDGTSYANVSGNGLGVGSQPSISFSGPADGIGVIVFTNDKSMDASYTLQGKTSGAMIIRSGGAWIWLCAFGVVGALVV